MSEILRSGQIFMYDLENLTDLNTAPKGQETSVFMMVHCLNLEQ